MSNRKIPAPCRGGLLKIIGITAIAVISIGCPPGPPDPPDTVDVEVPAIPSALTATPEDGRVLLTWNESSGATAYNIFRGVGDEAPGDTPITQISAGSSAERSYTDDEVTNGQTYRYAITAENSAGVSDRSDIVRATAGAIVMIVADSNEAEAGVQAIAPIPEQQAASVDRPIAILRATNRNNDQTLNAIAYSIVSPAQHPFAISQEGRLILPAAAAIDHEINQRFDLIIQGIGANGIMGMLDVGIAIQNIDDEAPVIAPVSSGIFVESGTTSFNIGSLTIVANDDLGDEIAYAFIDGDGSPTNAFDDFAIDGDTGAITVANAPTYSEVDAAANLRTLTIQAMDRTSGAIGELASRIELVIVITPVTTITLRSSAGSVFSIDESDDTPVNIATIEIVDEESTPAAVSPYRILNGHSGFSIADNGQLTAMIDYEALAETQQVTGSSPSVQAIELSLTIQGEDSTGAAGIIVLTVAARNIDDEAPVIAPVPSEISVESGATSFNIGALTIVANDDLGAEIAYAFIDGDGSPTDAFDDFAIDGDTGAITIANAPTYSNGDAAANLRTLTIQAMDRTPGAVGELASRIELVIAITPVTTITLRSSEGSVFSIDESDDTPVNIATIAIADEGSTPAAVSPYRILNGHSGFSIADDGQLTAMIDYEALAETQQVTGSSPSVQAIELSLTIQGEDSTGAVGIIDLTIAARNIDDETPVFVSPAMTAAVAAGIDTFQDGALTIVANDDLGDEIAYAFIDGDDSPTNAFDDFAIDGDTGAITVANAPTYSEVDDAANLRTLTIQATDRTPGAVGELASRIELVIEIIPNVDPDRDGLIDISTLEHLDNIRRNLDGTSYKTAEDAIGSAGGCPNYQCIGYELTRDLDFADAASYASNNVNADWRPTGGDPAMATNPGWTPIGFCNEDTDNVNGRCGDADDQLFSAIFDGNSYKIHNLYIRGEDDIGLFGAIGEAASIRAVGIMGGNIYGGGIVGNTGLLVGRNGGGMIASSYATGEVNGGDGIINYVGGLVGWNNNGTIISSHANGEVNGGDGMLDRVGGLVGWNDRGTIISSYAVGNADGGLGDNDQIGGLVGNSSGSIVASYATGNVSDDSGEDNDTGGLVGVISIGGTIISSYATGDVYDNSGAEKTGGNPGGLVGWNDGGMIASSYATGEVDGGNRFLSGELVGWQTGGTIAASYGFGAAMNARFPGETRSDDAVDAIHSPAVLTAATSSTIPANRWDETVWTFGGDRLYPVLNWITAYDETTGSFSCDDALLPASENCGAPIPGQYDSDGNGQDMTPAAPASAPTATAENSSITIQWAQVAGATAYRLYRNAEAGSNALDYRPIAEVSATEALSHIDNAPLEGDNYYAISAINGVGEGARSPSASAPHLAVDSDGDGLIDISTLEQLDAIRYNLEGTSYKTSASDSGNMTGCPATGCFGYELTSDLDFADGASYEGGNINGDWRPDNLTDPAMATNPGWTPIGSCNDDTDGEDGRCGDADDEMFASVFAGNGNTIEGLYIRGSGGIGLFGATTDDAEIRNVGLISDGIYGSDEDSDNVGVLVGFNNGTIASSYGTGHANGGEGSDDRVGGLAGFNRGTIIASYATGDARVDDGILSILNNVGGLVGLNDGGTIIASYAIGDANSDGLLDAVNALVGQNNSGTIVASYGFGDGVIIGTEGVERSDDADSSVHSPAALTKANSSTISANRWDETVWTFGGDRLYPVLNWITAYDETTDSLSCDDARLPAEATCGDPFPGQYDSDGNGQDMTPAAPMTAPTATADSSSITIQWAQVAGPTAYRLYRNAEAGSNALDYRPIAEVSATEARSYTDNAPLEGDNYYAISAINGVGEGVRSPSASAALMAAMPDIDIDTDKDGLIDINTLNDLNNMRYNLTGASYKTADDDEGNTTGCPGGTCKGYELMRSLDFADAASYEGGNINGDWRPDNLADPAMATNDGWTPIGSCNENADAFPDRCGDADDEPFAAIFEGNGHTITSLYSKIEAEEDGTSDGGLFGLIGAAATVRNIGILSAKLYDASIIGALASVNSGDIIASWADGPADSDNRTVGGLVGLNASSGRVIASYATVTLNGRTAGGLVGLNQGTIIASYATGNVSGNNDGFNEIGALVGNNQSGVIIASYATGRADGRDGFEDQVGGLIGFYFSATGLNSRITASYATGDVDGGDGGFDDAGSLIGRHMQGNINDLVEESYGFGSISGREGGMIGFPPFGMDPVGEPPTGVDAATELTADNAGARWNSAASDTMNAWDFGTAAQTPALRYADYDGDGTDYSCDMFPDTLPDGSSIVCGTTLIPGQK